MSADPKGPDPSAPEVGTLFRVVPERGESEGIEMPIRLTEHKTKFYVKPPAPPPPAADGHHRPFAVRTRCHRRHTTLLLADHFRRQLLSSVGRKSQPKRI